MGGLFSSFLRSLASWFVQTEYIFSNKFIISLLCDSCCSQSYVVLPLDLNLSRLPPDLEDLLAMKLDIRRKGERSPGWRKVGAEFKVNHDHLRYLDIEYKRDNGSPTVKLLQILGMNSNKTIADLVEVLKGPKVNRYDIANLIILTWLIFFL